MTTSRSYAPFWSSSHQLTHSSKNSIIVTYGSHPSIITFLNYWSTVSIGVLKLRIPRIPIQLKYSMFKSLDLGWHNHPWTNVAVVTEDGHFQEVRANHSVENYNIFVHWGALVKNKVQLNCHRGYRYRLEEVVLENQYP